MKKTVLSPPELGILWIWGGANVSWFGCRSLLALWTLAGCAVMDLQPWLFVPGTMTFVLAFAVKLLAWEFVNVSGSLPCVAAGSKVGCSGEGRCPKAGSARLGCLRWGASLGRLPAWQHCLEHLHESSGLRTSVLFFVSTFRSFTKH